MIILIFRFSDSVFSLASSFFGLTHTSSDGHTADQFQVHTDRVVLKTRRMVSTLVRNACEHPLKHAACQIWRPTFFEHIHTGGLPSRRPSVQQAAETSCIQQCTCQLLFFDDEKRSKVVVFLYAEWKAVSLLLCFSILSFAISLIN